MELRIRKRFQVLAPGSSLRRRVAYSLALVRIILVPVIVLAVYYLFQIGFIVDRIVSYDAPAATLAQQATIEMLDARRSERNYLLLNDLAALEEPVVVALDDFHVITSDAITAAQVGVLPLSHSRTMSSRKYTRAATSVPIWITAVNPAPGSSQPRNAGTTRMWAVLLMGRNSVSPWRRP